MYIYTESYICRWVIPLGAKRLATGTWEYLQTCGFRPDLQQKGEINVKFFLFPKMMWVGGRRVAHHVLLVVCLRTAFGAQNPKPFAVNLKP